MDIINSHSNRTVGCGFWYLTACRGLFPVCTFPLYKCKHAIFLELFSRKAKKKKEIIVLLPLYALCKKHWDSKCSWEKPENQQNNVPCHKIKSIFISLGSRLDLSEFSHSHHSLDTASKHCSSVHFSIHLLENHNNRFYISF